MDNARGMDLDQKYRPRRLEDVVGQPEAVSVIQGFKKKLPRCLLLHGQSGCGKTTLARIVAHDAGVSPLDLIEKNCGAVESAIDMVREIATHMSAAPMAGRYRMWILDEIQTFSKSQAAQGAILKILEDCPSHVLFALCTTDPQKLLPTIRGRCVQIGLRGLRDAEVTQLVKDVAAKERIKLTADLVEAIVLASGGSARDALKELEKAGAVGDPAEALKVVGATGPARAAFDLVKALLPWKGAPVWKDVTPVLLDIKDEDPEKIRQMVLASARTSLLRTGSPLAYKVIKCLSEPLYDRGSGHAILAAACYVVCEGGK